MKIRPYQQQMIDAAVSSFGFNKSTLLVVPTGGGKTFIAASILDELKRPALFLAHTKTLVEQAKKTLGDRADCFTMQSYRLSQKKKSYELVFIDEAHHSLCSSYKGIIDHHKESSYIIGLTATPEREGIKELFPVVHEVTIEELMEGGYLTPVRGIAITGIKANKEVSQTGGDFNVGELSLICNLPERNRFVVSTYKEYTGGDKLAIAFCCDIKHSLDMAANFCAEGIKALAVHGKLNDEELAYCYREFNEGRCKVLCSCMLLTEGFDSPKAEVALLCRPTRSSILFKQMVGRVLRLAEGKREALVLDFVYDGHSLSRARNVSSFPCERLEVVRVEGDPITKKCISRKLSPIEFINAEYDLLGRAAIDEPYVIPFGERQGLIICKSHPMGYKKWASIFLIISLPTPTHPLFFGKAYSFLLENKSLTLLGEAKGFSFNEVTKELIAFHSLEIKYTKGWAKTHSQRPTDLRTCEVLRKFRSEPTGNSLYDEEVLARKKVMSSLKKGIFVAK